MYRLRVFYPDRQGPRTTVALDRPTEVMRCATRLVGAHLGCSRIDVSMGDTHLFSLNSEGRRLN